MRGHRTYVWAAALLAIAGLGFATRPQSSADTELLSESALLEGLWPGAVFPFIDTTPNHIRRAHIAVTDETSNCSPDAAPPANVQVLVGQAGVQLVPVLTRASNTGISTTPGQCVFHVTVRAGTGRIPTVVTDIVVANTSGAPLEGFNTVTASATVLLQ